MTNSFMNITNNNIYIEIVNDDVVDGMWSVYWQIFYVVSDEENVVAEFPQRWLPYNECLYVWQSACILHQYENLLCHLYDVHLCNFQS